MANEEREKQITNELEKLLEKEDKNFTEDDFNMAGDLIQEAIDNEYYNIDITNYQIKLSKKFY